MRLRYLLPFVPLLMATDVGIWKQTFDATNVAAPSDTIPHLLTYDVRDPGPQTGTLCGPGNINPMMTDNAFGWSTTGGPYECVKTMEGFVLMVDPAPANDAIGVTLSGITPDVTGSVSAPAPTMASLRNGFQILSARAPYHERLVNEAGQTDYSLDGRICGSTGPVSCNYVNPPSLPRVLNAGDRVLKVKSLEPKQPDSGSVIADSSVLYIVSAIPAGCSASRIIMSGYEGATFAYCADDIAAGIATKLPQLATVSGQGPWNITFASQRFDQWGHGPAWIEACTGSSWQSGACTPISIINGANNDSTTGDDNVYGSPKTTPWISAMAVATQVGTPAQKDPLVMRLVSLGLHSYGAAQHGTGPWDGKQFFADGGIHSGRALPILFLAHMTDGVSPIYGVAPNYRSLWCWGQQDCFQESGDFYCQPWDWGTGAAKVGPCVAYSGRINKFSHAPCADNKQNRVRRCTNNHATLCKVNSDCGTGNQCMDSDTDGGGIHFSGGVGGGYPIDGAVCQPLVATQIADGKWTYDSYLVQSARWFGFVAVSRVLNEDTVLANQAIYPWVDVRTAAPWNGYCFGYCSAFLLSYYYAYGGP